MRDIELPITETFSVTVDVKELESAPLVDLGGGRVGVKLPDVVNPEGQEITAAARRNGGKILYATTSIEQKMDQLLLHYFMGPFEAHSERRVIFETEILQSSNLTFSTKKELVTKVIASESLLVGKKKNALQKYLKKIMDWRNAFAHGRIQLDSRDGCFVKHYSGSPKRLLLTDEFWDEVELGFTTCDTLLSDAFVAVNKER